MILNERFLRAHAQRKSITYASESVIMHANESIYECAEYKAYDIFLSHSYLDRALVLALIDLFHSDELSVYVDWIEDTQLDRDSVTAETADTLRTRMSNSEGLAYIASSNSVNSKWCPWELGYFDALKNGRCCILPVLKDDNRQFRGQEYLSLYPFLDYEKGQNEEAYHFWVNDSTDSQKYVRLTEWLKGKDLTIHK